MMLLSLLTLFFVQLVSAQTTIVTGKVTAGDTALSNVTVQVKGTKTFTQTDNNGNFSIAAAPTATLVFSSVGYAAYEMPVNSRTSLDVQLVSSASQLNEVVIIGYGTQKRKDITGAISSVNAATIAKVPVTTLDQALQGRAVRRGA